MWKLTATLALALLLLAGGAQAGTVTFNLDDLGPGPIAGTDTVTTWSTVDIDDGFGTVKTYNIGLKIGYEQTGAAPNSSLEVVDISGYLNNDPVWGGRSLSFFSAPGTDYGDRDFITLEPILTDFTDYPGNIFGVGQIGWDMGDVFGMDDDLWSIKTFGFPGAPGDYQPKESIDFPQGLTALGPGGAGLGLRDSANPDFKYSTERQNRVFAIQRAMLSAGHPDNGNSVYFDNFTLKFQEWTLFTNGNEQELMDGSDAPETAFGGGTTPPPPPPPSTGTGQIPAGAAIPLPGGVWLGMAMLAGLGAARSFRRRLGR